MFVWSLLLVHFIAFCFFHLVSSASCRRCCWYSKQRENAHIIFYLVPFIGKRGQCSVHFESKRIMYRFIFMFITFAHLFSNRFALEHFFFLILLFHSLCVLFYPEHSLQATKEKLNDRDNRFDILHCVCHILVWCLFVIFCFIEWNEPSIITKWMRINSMEYCFHTKKNIKMSGKMRFQKTRKWRNEQFLT